MAKKILRTVGSVALGLAKVGIFGYAFGAAITAVAGGVGGLFLAGAEAGVIAAKASEAKSDDDTESEDTESEKTQEDKAEFTE